MTRIEPGRLARVPLVGNLGYPIALKEVRSLIRRGKYFWAQFFYMAVLAVGVVILMVTSMDGSRAPEEVSANVFIGFFVLQHFLVYLVFPAFAATSISGERVERSFDLVVATDLKPAEIVWGKFIGIFGGCCYFLLVTLPILGTSVLFGGKSVFEALENYGLLLVQAALLTMYGIFVSTTSFSNIRSILGTYAMAFIAGGLTIGTLLGLAEEFGTVSLTQALAGLPTQGAEAIVLTAIFAVVTAFGLCFLGAVQRLMSPESNRAMPLRIFVFLAALTGIALVLHIIGGFQDGGFIRGLLGASRVISVLAVPALVVVFSAALLFAGSEVRLPLRVVRESARRPWRYRAVWLFLPGGVRGLAYALVLLALLLGGLELLAVVFFDLGSYTQATMPELGRLAGDAESVLEVFRMTWGAVFAFALAYTALAFLLSALEVQGVLNFAIVAGCAVLATCYATTFYAMELTEEWIHLYPLSLLVSLIRYYQPQTPAPAGELMECILAHVALAAAAFLLGALLLKRRGIPLFALHARGTT